MTNKLNSCSLWTHSHWAMLIILIFISTEICLIGGFHFRGLLIEISCEFVSPRTIKKHSNNNKGKKRKFLPFTIGFWVQLRPLTAATRERKLHMVSWLSSRSERRASISTLCMRSKISSVYLSPVSTCIQPNSPLFDDVILSHKSKVVNRIFPTKY